MTAGDQLSRPPNPGELFAVTDGIEWFRLPLPYGLDHINIFLVEDDGGWCVIDSGIGDRPSKDQWLAMLAGPLAHYRLTRLIVTHQHPDHIGLAGWLDREHRIPVWMSAVTYETCARLAKRPDQDLSARIRAFYRANGLSESSLDAIGSSDLEYVGDVTPLPGSYVRLAPHHDVKIGDRMFRLIAGYGHAPELLMLYCEEHRLLFCADQLMARVSPDIREWLEDPDQNPLDDFLRSTRKLQSEIVSDVLLLPGHQTPSRELRANCNRLVAFHERRCRQICVLCTEAELSVGELMRLMFRRELAPGQLAFVFSELLSYTAYMVGRNELARRACADGVIRHRSVKELAHGL